MMEEIIDHFGTQANLARALKVERAVVNNWVRSGQLPALRAIEIERLTDGKFRAVDLIEPERKNERFVQE